MCRCVVARRGASHAAGSSSRAERMGAVVGSTSVSSAMGEAPVPSARLTAQDAVRGMRVGAREVRSSRGALWRRGRGGVQFLLAKHRFLVSRAAAVVGQPQEGVDDAQR